MGKLAGDPPWGGGARALVVDDEPVLARFTGDQLERLGYQVRIVSSAAEVRRVFAAEGEGNGPGIAVLVADENLGDASGSELGRALLDEYPGLSVVIVSGWSHILAELRGRSGGAVLAKPFAHVELAQAVLEARALARGRAEGRGGGTRTRDT